ncbi:MAG TPA: hypothetical protein VFU47_12100, partial [Armatimonadota bacterium]|nr:hypothetical protein [Armatimonadota bacterium]
QLAQRHPGPLTARRLKPGTAGFRHPRPQRVGRVRLVQRPVDQGIEFRIYRIRRVTSVRS